MNKASAKTEETSLIEQAKAFFLRVVIDDFKTAQAQYDLNDEFAKTKRNRNLFVLLIILLTTVVFISFAFVLNNYYEKANNVVTIRSAEFDDINLRDLLDKAKKLEADIGFTKLQIQTLQDARNADIARATITRDDALTMLRSRNPSEEDLTNQTAQIESGYQSQLRRIGGAYSKQIKSFETEVSAAQAQLASFDSGKLELAKQQEVVLNNERRIYDLERDRIQIELEGNIKRLTNDYESRLRKRNQFLKDLESSFNQTLSIEHNNLIDLYNPKWVDDRSAALLSEPLNAKRLESFRASIPKRYIASDGISQNIVDSINKQLNDYHYLISLLSKVPYSNSVPPALFQLQYRTLEILDLSTSAYDVLWQSIDDKKSQIGQLKIEAETAKSSLSQVSKAMDQYLNSLNKDMAVMDILPGGDLAAFVRNGVDLKPGQHVYAIKANGEVSSEYEVKDTGKVRHLKLIAPLVISDSPTTALTDIIELTKNPGKPYLTGNDVEIFDSIISPEAWPGKTMR